MRAAKRAGRYWRTLCHLRAGQLGWLVWRRVLRQPRSVSPPSAAHREAGFRAPPSLGITATILEGSHAFTFLNRRHDFGTHIDWRAPGATRLWLYNLHYFDWLRQREMDPRLALAHARAWTADNPPFAGAGWEPYPVSLRLVNWITAFGDDDPGSEIIDSLALQAAWLERNLEFHLRANHLFVNIKALLFAGAFFSGQFGASLRARGERLLKRELAEQFLADGGHFERSPMYHALMCQDLLELLALMRHNPNLFSAEVMTDTERTALAALEFAIAIGLPGDRLALFNDSSEGIAPSLSSLREYAGTIGLNGVAAAREDERVLTALPESGYFVVREGSDVLIAGCGEIGPAYQPGHAHCDLLSFELVLDGRKVVVNCGNYDYENSFERRYARSTAAHNTVSVDGEEQSEIWGVFRVGRRARPLAASLEATPGGALFRGAHDGYRHLPGAVVHARDIVVDATFNTVIVDELRGDGEHVMVAWLHFADDCTVEYDDGRFTVARENAPVLSVEVTGRAAVELRATPRYPRFGVRHDGPSLRISLAGALPLRMETRLHRVVRHGTG